MPKGFAALTPERRREISARGGKAAHAAGTAHRFTRTEAIAAGSKGGKASKKRDMALAALLGPTGATGAPAGEEPKGLNGPGPIETLADSALGLAASIVSMVAPTEPPPPVSPTEPAPPLVVEQTTIGPAHPDVDELQRVYDEAMARS